ncbi:hypothetical protein [Myroides sp. WP-1]|uniref:hypothetical protein n=1 Tax=Myroides sp. WP-1 TaxID=2759944 RepID=UPI0015FA35D0|nr:hypothetical protein [Myroides sp. WP-1]MBB1139877.1 hypothetical protein [Myroides sp. WP-1]
MKKILAVLFGAIAIAACSSSDDNSSSVDPIFSQPYTELANLDELVSGKWAYVGNKIGDRKVGLVEETNECKKKDYLVVHRTGTSMAIDSLSYNNYGMRVNNNERVCTSVFEFPRISRNLKLTSSGNLYALITDDVMEPVLVPDGDKVDKDGKPIMKPIFVRKRKSPAHHDGNLEIGFQAGYLRVEDYLSDYSRLKNEKVYLYFKKM